jgi:hypothetical protein
LGGIALTLGTLLGEQTAVLGRVAVLAGEPLGLAAAAVAPTVAFHATRSGIIGVTGFAGKKVIFTSGRITGRTRIGCVALAAFAAFAALSRRAGRRQGGTRGRRG